MKEKFKKCLRLALPLVLACLILAGCVSENVTDGTDGAFVEVTGTFAEQFAQLVKNNFGSSVQKSDATYETMTVLISLSGKSLSEYAGKENVSSYIASSEGQQKTEDIYAQQDKILAKLTKAGIEYTLKYRYTAVDNAIAVEIDTSYVSKIKKMSGVESVVLSHSYSAPETVELTGGAGSAITNSTSVYKTGVYNSSAAIADGLDGSGMVVAIIDTGLDYTHSAFQDMPDSETLGLTKEDVAQILASKSLHAEELAGVTVDDVYYNAKVPFMFDYADKDANVYPSYSNHGTHVAGIVAGHDPNGYTDKDGNHIDDAFWGVAPQAQLVICKVFTDDLESKDLGGATTEDIVAALDDCVALGVDVINMSLGTTCGFTSTDDGDDEGEYLNRVYTKVGEAGVSLVCAASNDYSAGFGSAFGTNLKTNPDSGTVGSPSTFPAALSVASISGKMSNYLLANNNTVVFFQESNDGNSNPFDFMEMILDGKTKGEFEYVVIPGVGLASDYTASIKELVKGRVALVKRGDNSFQEKVELAMQYGAIGIIVYNNVSGTVRMTLGDIEEPIPAISIDMESGEAMVKGATNRVGKIVVDTSYAAGPFMSDFSSWGATADLKLKPEITAHGGEITSSVPGGYGEQSGTSMASPNMAGVVALIRSYVKQTFPAIADDATAVNRLVNQLLMSTATTVLDEDGLPYSPRKQGAGLGSLDNARFTAAYLWTNNADNDYRPKIELGDDKNKTGKYSFSFNLTNFGTTELSFKTNALFMTESLSIDGLAVAEQAHLLEDIAALWTVDGKAVADGAVFSIPAGATYEITLTLELSDAEKAYIEESFPNGMFVEGFAKLISMDESNEANRQCDLVLPYMGFYGDWTQAPMLDYDAYELGKYQQDSSIADDEKPQASVWATQPYVSYYNEEYTLPMGSFLYLQDSSADQIYAEMEHNAISCYDQYFGENHVDNYLTSYKFRGLYAGLLRSAREVTYQLTNAETGEVLEEDVIYRVGKAYAGAGTAVPAFVKFDTDPTELGLISGEKYTMSFKFYLDYNVDDIKAAEAEAKDGEKVNGVETYEFSFYADYEAPVLQDVRVRYYDYKDSATNKIKQKIYLDLDVYDNHYAQSVMLTYLDGNELKLATEYVTPVYNANKNGTTTVSIEITDIYDQYKGNLYVQLDDYALNHSQYWLNLEKCNSSNAPDYFELAAGEETVELDIYESHKVSLVYVGDGNLSNFDWTSNNRSVAEVRNGEIVGLSTGTTTITVSNGSGLRQSITVTVTDQKAELPIPSISFGNVPSGDGTLTKSSSYVEKYPGNKFQLTVNTDPWYYPADQLELVWKSTNEKVATVDQNGNVEVLAKGSASIQAYLVIDGKETLYTATITIRALDPYEVSGVTLVKYHGSEENVVIPTDKNIMMISEEAFMDNNTMKTLVIPKTVMQIGKRAFKNCTALEEVYFDSIETQEIADCDLSIIFQEAFSGCTALRKVDFSNLKVVTLGRECFYGCTSLTEIIRLDKASTVYQEAFANCTSLKTVDLTGLFVCGDGAFSGCKSLTNVITGPKTNLGQYIFRNCEGLTSITLSASQVGSYAFSGCNNLRSVTFTGDVSASVGAYAFAGCKKLTSVKFNEGVTIWSIGNGAFANTALKSFTIPNGLTVLGSDILSGSSVSKIVISDSFDFDSISFVGLVFDDMDVTLAEDCTKYVMADGVIYNSNKTKLLLVTSAAETVQLPDTVTAIGDYAFAGTTVTEVTIPATVKVIGTAAFRNSSIENLTFAAGCQIEVIPAYAFAGSNLSTITIPASVKTIEEYAFANSNLSTVNFGADNIRSIGDRAFYACLRLTKVTLPDGVRTMGDGVFRGCTQLREAKMPSVQELGINTFYGCTRLEMVTFGDNATTLGNSREEKETLTDDPELIMANTFVGCTALKNVNFGENITKIEDGVFTGCTALVRIDLKNVTELGQQVFAECAKLATVDGMERLQVIGDTAFYNCNALTELKLDAAKTIGNYAFAIANGGSAYTKISIPAAEQIGNMAFYGGSESTVRIPASLTKLGYGAFASSKKLTGFDVEEGGVFFAEDGVLLRTIGKNNYELCAFPSGKNMKNETYVVPEGTSRVASYAFYGLSKNAPEKVDLPWSVTFIGVSAFENSGIRNYIFRSINAPVLGTEYREDVVKLMEDAYTTMEDPAMNSLYYANFDSLMVYYTKMLGYTSDLEMAFPENGVGYDNFVWSTYFGKTTSLGILMDNDTRDAISAIEELESPEDIQKMLDLTVNDENKELVVALAARVKEARRLFNNVISEEQKTFLTAEYADKLTAVETVMRQLKEKFGIKLELKSFTWNDYKKEYKEGESFDLSSLILTIVYDDGSTALADMTKLTQIYPDYSALTVLDNVVRFKYDDGEVSGTVSLTVKVTEAGAGDDNKNDSNDSGSSLVIILVIIGAVILAGGATVIVLKMRKNTATEAVSDAETVAVELSSEIEEEEKTEVTEKVEEVTEPEQENL